jgi:hypothetical protein
MKKSPVKINKEFEEVIEKMIRNIDRKYSFDIHEGISFNKYPKFNNAVTFNNLEFDGVHLFGTQSSVFDKFEYTKKSTDYYPTIKDREDLGLKKGKETLNPLSGKLYTQDCILDGYRCCAVVKPGVLCGSTYRLTRAHVMTGAGVGLIVTCNNHNSHRNGEVMNFKGQLFIYDSDNEDYKRGIKKIHREFKDINKYNADTLCEDFKNKTRI